jgi:hypothetical protein
MGFVQVGQDGITICFCKATEHLSGLDEKISTLVFKFDFIFLIGIGCGQTEY